VVVLVFLLVIIERLALDGLGCEVVTGQWVVEGTESFCDGFGDFLF
jgi:hypothetical protein